METIIEMKTCTKCGSEYPATLEFFYANKQVKSGLRCDCRLCHNKTTNAYQKKHLDKVRVYCAKYRAGHGEQERARQIRFGATINGCLRNVYRNMKKRCGNPKCQRYKDYGGRGIKCLFTSDEFVNYVTNVLQVDPRGLQVDRIDNDGNYEPGNIRFVTAKVNCQNRKRKAVPA